MIRSRSHSTLLDRNALPEDKIALFRSLFRGREEVYPLRFESRRTGSSGYQPACANEWVRGVCEKPRVKCFDCPNRRFLPVTDETVRCHLLGHDDQGKDFVVGVYPMLLDETCHFLAIDFDRDGWREDVLAFRETCRQMGIPVALERSRSGNGAHAWIFFSETLPATLARKFGAHLLTETMERHPDIGFRSYDRLFPNQDTLPKGGFGNLIALPLQGRARERGNSVFVDERLNPFPDQWRFLAEVSRLSSECVSNLAREAESRGRITGVRLARSDDDDDDEDPWELLPSRCHREPPIEGTLPGTVEIVSGDQLYVPKTGLPPGLRNRIVRLAAFQNPEFHKAQAMRLPTWNKPRIIDCAEDHSGHIGLPRGCLVDLQSLLGELGIECAVRDERVAGRTLNLEFCGELRPEQERAAIALLAHDTGVLAATTAFGKTVVAASMIARRGVNTLVLVHRKHLMEQWVERLSQFLGIEPEEIGRFGGGRKRLSGRLDIALLQSFVRKGVVDDRISDYGHIVVDECHHLAARSFELAVRRAKARFVLGLSATVVRKDGQHPIIFMQCGPVRHRVDARDQAKKRPFTHQVIVRPTGFQLSTEPDTDQRLAFSRITRELSECEPRNRLILEDVLAAVREGRSPLVLTERIEHLETLAEALRPKVDSLVTLRGGMGKKALSAALEELSADSVTGSRVVVATGRFVGEGFDDSRLDTLFLTLPVSWRGTIAQYVGRLHRLHDGKREVRVHDYADLDVPMLERMFDRRCRGYEAVGYTILLPGSALPGWPAAVPLPVDPEWKRDYAASVRRLIRDGVEVPLAESFVRAAEKQPTGAIDAGELAGPTQPGGPGKARSASEEFLHRRLETLPETTGRFELNARLPIPFGDEGHMEVDFHCASARLAIELDGPQHLGDPIAWRRDRRKDVLLQEHGYFVLRFLAEDLSSRLDEILDTILRALAHQERKT